MTTFIHNLKRSLQMKHQTLSSQVENHFLLVTILLWGLFFHGRKSSTFISGSTHTCLHLKSSKERQSEEDSLDPHNSAVSTASPGGDWPLVHFALQLSKSLLPFTVFVSVLCFLSPAAFLTVFRSIKVNWTQALKDAQYSSSDNKLC